MRTKIAVSFAPVTGVVLSLLFAQGTAFALPPRRVLADSGMVSLGPNQVLRLTVTSRTRRAAQLRFGRLQYQESGCGQGVCDYAIASRNLSDPVTLAPSDAVSAEIPGGSSGASVRLGILIQNSTISGFSVNAEIRDANTNEIIAILIGLLAPQGGAPALFDLKDPVE